MALKVGTEDRKKVAIAAALGLVVLLLAAKTIFGGPDTPSVPPPQPAPVSAVSAPSPTTVATSRTTAASSTSGLAPRASAAAQLDPTLHPELMAENESFVYGGNGRNIFSMNSAPAAAATTAIPKVKAPIRPSALVAAAPIGPPPPPNIDLKFFGYSARRDGSKKAFLLHGDDVFIAAEGDVVSHRYKVGKIATNSVQVEDLPYHNTQSLPLVAN